MPRICPTLFYRLCPVILTLATPLVCVAQDSPDEGATAPAPWFPGGGGNASLTLDQFREQLFAYNEQIQIQLLGVMVAEQTYQAARGVFDPEFVGDLEHVDSLRPNTAEEEASRSNLDLFDEKNTLFSSGIEQLTPSNARVRLGFNVFRLRNNIQLATPDRPSPEYSTFLGANFTQPLLRDAGRAASMAALRLAARESEMAFQDYRRQMMATAASGEAAYWGLYVANQEVQFAQESLKLARTILGDTQKAQELGAATEADVMEARVAVLERESTLSLAQQQRFEAGSTLVSFFSNKPIRRDSQLPRTTAPPNPTRGSSAVAADRLWNTAFGSNPDYLRRLTQIELEGVRVAYAKNQKRPRLDLKASYGLNGLGDSFSTGFNNIEDGEFPAWSIGLEMRVPFGNRAGKANLTAAQARKAQALLGLKEAEVQLNVAMENALRKIETAAENLQAAQAAVGLRQTLLEDERESQAAGRSNIRNVFEVEEELERSKAAALRSLLEIQTTALQLELVAGTILSNRGWETSYDELKTRTESALKRATDRAEESKPDDPKKPKPANAQPKPSDTGLRIPLPDGDGGRTSASAPRDSSRPRRSFFGRLRGE